MRPREVLVLILIIVAGVTLTNIHKENWDIGIDFGDIFFDYEYYSYEEIQELSPPFPDELQIINSYGSVEVRGTDEEAISIHMEKRIRRRTEEKAREAADQLEMVIERNPDRIILSTNRSEVKARNLRTHFTLRIPNSMDVRIKNSYGLVKVVQVGELDIGNSNGEIYVEGVQNNLTITNSYEDVEIIEVGGDCQITSRQSDIQLKQIQGNVHISHRYGTIILDKIARDVTIDGHDTEIFAQDISGKVETESSYEDIQLRSIGSAIVRSNGSSVYINGAQGDVDLNVRYGDIEMLDIKGNIQVTGKDMGVYGRSLYSGQIYIETSYEDVELHEFTGKTTISLDNGNLKLYPAPLTDSIEVKGTYAGIRLFWPAGGIYPFEAQTKGGSIDWGLSAQPSMRVENGHSIIKAFTEETQFPAIKIATTYGDIQVLEAGSEEEHS